MTPNVTPMGDIERRLPMHGKIRFGTRGSRGEPKKLTTLRFTSPDREAIVRIAALYGGTPEIWSDAPVDEQWQVTTTARSVPIALPPAPLYGPHYEMWSGGGLQRRCDGVRVTMAQGTPDGGEEVTGPCICNANGQLACSPKVRLSVILRDIRFAGVWMVESSGWNAVHELPGMVDVITAAQSAGVVSARLTMSERKKTVNSRTRRFTVPELSLDSSIDELMSGNAALASVSSGDPVPALPEGSDSPDPYSVESVAEFIRDDLGPSDDEDIVDAEVIEDSPKPPSPPPPPPPPEPRGGPGGVADTPPPERQHGPPTPIDMDEATVLLMQSLANDHRIDPPRFMDAMLRWADGDVERLTNGVEGLRTGAAIWRGFDDTGAARINRPRSRT